MSICNQETFWEGLYRENSGCGLNVDKGSKDGERKQEPDDGAMRRTGEKRGRWKMGGLESSGSPLT